METERLKLSLLEDAEMRQRFFSLPVDSELGMSTHELPGGNSIAVLSPAHSNKAIYLSPGITLAPEAEIAVHGAFEAVIPEGVLPLPVQAVELCGRAGLGWPDTALTQFVSPLQNSSKVPLRLALRLLPVSELPQKFLLFFPQFKSAGRRSNPPPVLFSKIVGRGVCIFGGVVQQGIQRDGHAFGVPAR
jgi:hypothetical protein